jgi:hypothetical protein
MPTTVTAISVVSVAFVAFVAFEQTPPLRKEKEYKRNANKHMDDNGGPNNN